MKKKTIKKIGGWAIIVIMFLALFGATVLDAGLGMACVIWGAGIGGGLLIVKAIDWIMGD